MICQPADKTQAG